MTTDNMDDNSAIDSEVLADDELELLTTPFVDLRLFNLNNNAGSTIMGIAITEMEDSFLVGLPCRLLKLPDGNLQIGPYVPTKLIRLFKNSVVSMTVMFGDFLEYYTAFLKNKGLIDFPEFKAYFGPELYEESKSPSEVMTETMNEMKVSKETEDKIIEAMSLAGIGSGNTLVH
jgi:hypothetical protein